MKDSSNWTIKAHQGRKQTKTFQLATTLLCSQDDRAARAATKTMCPVFYLRASSLFMLLSPCNSLHANYRKPGNTSLSCESCPSKLSALKGKRWTTVVRKRKGLGHMNPSIVEQSLAESLDRICIPRLDDQCPHSNVEIDI